MRLGDISLVLGIDREHLEELRMTWPTWMRFKPELREMPLIVFYDPKEIDLSQAEFLNQHPSWRGVSWEWDAGFNQREKMITGWLHVPAHEVKTPWYLKLDTDVAAFKSGQWIFEDWFHANKVGSLPVFISSVWSYSKPVNVIDVLDDWGDGIASLSSFPRLEFPYSGSDERITHPRIISWLFFGRTDWTREVASWLPGDGRLPHPSQDTFLFYCAERQRQFYIRERMGLLGWKHLRSWKIKEFVEALER